MAIAERLRSARDFLATPWATPVKASVLTAGGTGPLDQGVGALAAGWQWSTPLSSSGVVINDTNAQTVSAWHMGLRVISRDLAAFPLHLYRVSQRDVNGQMQTFKDKALDHPLYAILHDSPNPEMTSYVFRQTLQAHLLSWGNAYAEKELNGSGRTIALWPLRPDRMDVRWEGGRRVYYYRVRETSAPVRMTSDRVFHIPGLGFDGLRGYSVLTMARETLGSAIALREYGNRVLANDARPSVVLQHPAALSDKARANLRESWESSHGGLNNAGRMALLEEGMTLKDFGYPPEDIQFLDSQKWTVTEVARWLELTPHKVNDLEHATFSNVEELNIEHVSGVMRGWCTAWEQQLNKDVVQDPTLFVEHNMDALLRGKTLDRAQANTLKINAGAMVPNEWRAQDNENPLAWGDERVSTPNNTAPTPTPGGPA